jgi:hypothetical protein
MQRPNDEWDSACAEREEGYVSLLHRRLRISFFGAQFGAQMERGFFAAVLVLSTSVAVGNDEPTALLVIATAATDSAPTKRTHAPTSRTTLRSVRPNRFPESWSARLRLAAGRSLGLVIGVGLG